ncbi:protein BUNDLE SHEATH DEFECTIVE 2, chloroplastic [Salvia hispanica]|uniref:protein BUNDLE SHEATH DEFECTIVE 2, chloroplastic n=1 Tax=Salvia hispanica TaxID=49212 RepID=UPI00200954AA|nr:protein BUNDLE SHEATH DEFECTIVE 2, chloroplastic [Salvia hispanica]
MAFPTNIFSTTCPNPNLSFPINQQLLNSNTKSKRAYVKCSRVEEQDCGILCESCSGIGWVVCEYCKGVKTNVKGEKNKIYRRCPSCRAIGSVLCSKCKVYKCVTFPDINDGLQ